VVEIKDCGLGIPEDHQNKIFSKFFRAKNAVLMDTEGSGLGLYIIKAIVESSKGKIWFTSEENKGTTFWFTLPK
jgi:two-component system sensor histidine kinase VicK